MNKSAQALGRLAAGIPKKFSQAEIKRRTERLKEARKVKLEKLNNQKGK